MSEPCIRVIIVDDQKLFSSGLAALFKKHDIDVIELLENGAELLRSPRVEEADVILLDLEMPVMDGSKTLSRLLKQQPAQKAIILSKYHDRELVKDCFNRGARAFISKSSPLETVVSAIKNVYLNGIYKDNMHDLLRNTAVKDGHYYKLLFTRRECAIVQLLCLGKSYKLIASELFISEKTVENHVKAIFKKAAVKSRSEFLVLALKHGLQYISDN